ncbi:MAG: hypothetical protein NT093_04735 [Candidatus Moranbacteria bacterium]|nr:hypothetical protein [Candidatus Moranbacteria bacterium]
MKKQSACPPARRGSGLIFAVVLLFVILGMVVTLSSVTVLETKMNQKTKSSVGAFYNSEAGVEWALNKISNATGSNISDAFPGFSGNKYPCPSGFNCDMYFLDETGNVITSNLTINKVEAVRSVGTQGGETQRAIEAAVASTCNNSAIAVTPDTVTTNTTGKKLIVVAYTSASVSSNDLIGETAAPSGSLNMVATDSSSTADVARSSITFVVPPGWIYRVRLGTSGSHSIDIQAWEVCS